MSVLQDFYNGYTPPKKDFGDNTFSGYLALKESAEQREKELLISLSEEQIRLYKRIRNDRSDMTGLDLERMFIYAFKIGIKFAQELNAD